MADREKLIELLGQCSPPNMRVCRVDGDRITMSISQGKIADHLIANGVTVRERGRWEDVSLRFTQVKEKCSVCGGIVYAHGFNFCPNCGADMK